MFLFSCSYIGADIKQMNPGTIKLGKQGKGIEAGYKEVFTVIDLRNIGGKDGHAVSVGVIINENAINSVMRRLSE